MTLQYTRGHAMYVYNIILVQSWEQPLLFKVFLEADG